ncbi:alpha-amylase [Vallitalea longa]|uniref:Alpha-amylase n=1 Tax=Vallitalea longa TaxID=2936439 RepID=A0A9W6DGP7_9FIRM|nr:alpha-amylase family glycosyl hydrolase [Vallitalea longa]GKX30663.1 alpha-amylase [Vallitalea longa]
MKIHQTLLLFILCIVILLTSCGNSSVNKNWFDDAVIYEVNLRQYTKEGTISAFKNHLPRLQELGVKVLWFMPIYPISKVKRNGSLGSYYSVQDYKAVNPEFGTFEEFKNLVQECHELGFKVILDWVPNHTGWDNEWVYDHPEWYTQMDGKIIQPAGTNWTDVADLNYNNLEMQKAMIDALSYWITEADIDGYRCDVAGKVPVDFWNKAITELNCIKPVFMLAEDGDNMSLLSNGFTANYGWPLLGAINKSSDGNGRALTIKRELLRVPVIYPDGTLPMNFLTNHDENSWNGTTTERLGSSVDAMNVLIFTSPGLPLIYSGQEASLNKRLEFFDKDEIDWSDLSKQDFYKNLIQLKKENPALWNNNIQGKLTFINTSNKQLLIFIRKKDDNTVITTINLSNKTINATCEFGEYAGEYNDYFNDEKISLSAEYNIDMTPFSYFVFVK